VAGRAASAAFGTAAEIGVPPSLAFFAQSLQDKRVSGGLHLLKSLESRLYNLTFSQSLQNKGVILTGPALFLRDQSAAPRRSAKQIPFGNDRKEGNKSTRALPRAKPHPFTMRP